MSTTLYALRQNTGTTVQAFPSQLHPSTVITPPASVGGGVWHGGHHPFGKPLSRRRRDDELALAVLGAI